MRLMENSFRLPLVLFAAAVLGSTPAQAITVAIVSDLDNTLYESSTGALSNGAGPTFFAGRTAQATSSIRRGLVHFDVAAAIPAEAVTWGRIKAGYRL